MDTDRSKSIKGFWTVSDSILVKLSGRPFDVNVIQVYASIADSSEDSIDEFYTDLEKAFKKCKNSEVNIIMNAKVRNQQEGWAKGTE